MVDFNWNLLQQPDFAGNAVNAFKAGAEVRQDRDKRNALNVFSQDPEAGIAALTKGGFIKEAGEAGNLWDSSRKRNALSAAYEDIKSGNYTGAGRTIAGVDPETAQQFFNLGEAELQHLKTLGERAGAVMLSAASLTNPEQRRQFALQHRDEMIAAGIPAEKFDRFDWNNVALLRAEGLRFADLNKLAGAVTIEKFGDNAVTVRSSPFGASFEGSTPIPETREDRRQDRAENRQERQETRQERESRERSERISPNDVIGPILRKKAAGEALTDGEIEIYENYKARGGTDFMSTILDGDDGAYGPTATPPAQAPPQRTTPPKAADPYPGIAPGEIVVQGGKRYQRQGNQMVPVK